MAAGRIINTGGFALYFIALNRLNIINIQKYIFNMYIRAQLNKTTTFISIQVHHRGCNMVFRLNSEDIFIIILIKFIELKALLKYHL